MKKEEITRNEGNKREYKKGGEGGNGGRGYFSFTLFCDTSRVATNK